jgi:alpha-beta hydrolase superfamily lysophospholipase
MSKFEKSRRAFLGTAPVLAGSLAAGNLARVASAAEPAAAASDGIWSKEYWANKDDVKLYMFRKRVGAPKPGENRPVVFLAHGSSVSSRPSYDLAVPGHGEYSFMDQLARSGFDVWTMDFEGYGRSTVTSGNSNIADGVEDLKAAVPLMVRETGQERLHFFGESSGALRVGVYGTVEPGRVNRLILASFTYTGKDSPTLTERAKQVDFYRAHNRRPRDLAMIQSIFTRDKAGTTDPAVGEAIAKVELPLGDSAPTGTYLDMCTKLPLVDPKKVKSPTLILRGEYDGIATMADLLDFFGQVPSPDRQITVLPGLAHSLGTGYNRQLMWHAAISYLKAPPRQDVQSGA